MKYYKIMKISIQQLHIKKEKNICKHNSAYLSKYQKPYQQTTLLKKENK